MARGKIFKHKLVDYVDAYNVDAPEGRYYMVEGMADRKFRSVTTVLGQKTDKTALMEWKKRVGEEEAQKISTQAARRGTAVHSLAERYVLNEEDYSRGAMPSVVDSFSFIKRILDDHVDNIVGLEIPLYSVALNAAGRCDLIAEYDGTLSIIDFKTSLKPKKEEWITNYFLQTTCYAMMFSWMYKIRIKQIVVMISVDNEPAQVFVKPVKDYVNTVVEMFRS